MYCFKCIVRSNPKRFSTSFLYVKCHDFLEKSYWHNFPFPSPRLWIQSNRFFFFFLTLGAKHDEWVESILLFNTDGVRREEEKLWLSQRYLQQNKPESELESPISLSAPLTATLPVRPTYTECKWKTTTVNILFTPVSFLQLLQ